MRGIRDLCQAVALLALPVLLAGFGPVPKGYPRSYSGIVEGAAAEQALIIYSTTDRREVAALLSAFRERFPFIRVDYRELPSTVLHRTFLDETHGRRPSADLLWSAAMDLQTKLVNDGYAQAYASPEKPNLPSWALWKNQAYGVTAEPIVIAYNRRLVPAADVPRTHADLTRLLRAKAAFYRGRVATYDPVRSSVGYLYLSQDLQLNRDTSALVSTLGDIGVSRYESSSEMLEPLAKGQHLIAYNMIGSYALKRQLQDPAIGVVMPSDYTLLMSRIALIPSEARHPNAAKLFLDFLLSRRGQELLARRYMIPVRLDVAAPAGARPPSPSARAIRVGPALIANLDQLKRRRVLLAWNAAITR